MRMKLLQLFGWITVAAATLQGEQPPTTGAQYWSTDPSLNCSDGSVAPYNYHITLSSGGTGYVCIASGTFVWLAAGGQWGSSIRVAATSLGAIGVDYSFYDTSGNSLALDTRLGSRSDTVSSDDVNFVLNTNQPEVLNLLGAPGGAPNYSSLVTGSVFAVYYCPDAITCRFLLPQLLYSALPSLPWSLSVPISWSGSDWSQWSAQGIDDGAGLRVSLVIYNPESVATAYTVRIYDSAGKPAGTGVTPAIASGGTYGELLSNVVRTPLPSGLFKILIDGGSNFSWVAIIQITGPSATSLQVTYDFPPAL